MKEYEVLNEKTRAMEILNEKQIAEMMLPAGFYGEVLRMKVNESMFHHLTMLSFKRVK